MLTYPCTHCGRLVSLEEVDQIDSGTTLFCPQCGGPTIVDLRRGVRPPTVQEVQAYNEQYRQLRAKIEEEKHETPQG